MSTLLQSFPKGLGWDGEERCVKLDSEQMNACITNTSGLLKIDGYLSVSPFLKPVGFYSLDLISLQFHEISVYGLLSSSIAKIKSIASQLAVVFNSFP